MDPPARRRTIVDAMNVIGARPDGWWRDPDAAKRRLVDRLGRLASASGEAFTVVIDGRPAADLPEGVFGAVEVLYATRPGRDAADDRIVSLIADRDGDRVVTSDGELRRRVVALGAEVQGASWLLDRLDGA